MIIRIVVDLPDPLGPRKPVTVPGRTSKDRSSTATTLPNRLESPRASITRSALHGAPPFWVSGITLTEGSGMPSLSRSPVPPPSGPHPQTPVSRRRLRSRLQAGKPGERNELRNLSKGVPDRRVGVPPCGTTGIGPWRRPVRVMGRVLLRFVGSPQTASRSASARLVSPAHPYSAAVAAAVVASSCARLRSPSARRAR